MGDEVIYHEATDIDLKNQTGYYVDLASVSPGKEINYETLKSSNTNLKGKQRITLWKISTLLLLIICIILIGGISYLAWKIFSNGTDSSSCNSFHDKKSEFSTDMTIGPTSMTPNTISDSNCKKIPYFQKSFDKTWYGGDNHPFHPCRDGWIFNETTFACYFVSDNAKSWNDSQDFCARKSSCLTNVLSLAEAEWIGSLTKNDTWVGGGQNGSQYQWNCDLYKYHKIVNRYSTLWAEGEPKPGNVDQCLQLWNRKDGFLLDDHYCDVEKKFVCKSSP